MVVEIRNDYDRCTHCKGCFGKLLVTRAHKTHLEIANYCSYIIKMNEMKACEGTFDNLGCNGAKEPDVLKIVKEDVLRILCERKRKASLKIIKARNIILATGGPAILYKNSVYPESQKGSTSLAIEAGCILQNLTESQFGLASTKFRWNVSGSYQQVIPRYISVDNKNNNNC